MAELNPIPWDYYLPQSGDGRKRSFGEELFKLALLATVFIAYGLYGDSDKPIIYFFSIGIILWIVVAVVDRRVRQQDARRTSATVSCLWRRSIWSLVAVTFLLPNLTVVYPYRCPHGIRWTNRLIGVAWSTNGGPCGDGPHAWGTKPWNVYGNWYVYFPRS